MGNLLTENTGGQVTTYGWDVTNRMTSVTTTSTLEQYVYSADGLRQRKLTSAGTTQYVWDAGNVMMETNSGGSVQAFYTHNPDSWASLLSQNRSGVSNVCLFDPTGSTRGLNSVPPIPASVTVRNTGTTGHVVADAVRFVLLSAVQTLDNAASSGITVTGSWTPSTNEGGYYGPNYLDDGFSGQGTKSVRFTPVLPAPGSYEVYAWWPSSTSNASNVPIDVITAGGTTTVMVNQQQKGGRWFPLGTYTFTANGAEGVLIRNTGANGHVIADAVRFIPTNAETILDNSATSGITVTGSWTTSTSESGYYGPNYFDDGATNKGGSSVRYAPILPLAGTYEVDAWWPAAMSNAPSVPIDVANSTTTSTVMVNQLNSDQGGQWNSLGTFSFAALPAGPTGTYLYDAFGNNLSSSGTVVNPFQFGGEYGYYQDAPNRSYVQQRHLHLPTGRWMSEDPIGFWGGDVNLYRYCGGNPVGRVDPSGCADPLAGFDMSDGLMYHVFKSPGGPKVAPVRARSGGSKKKRGATKPKGAHNSFDARKMGMPVWDAQSSHAFWHPVWFRARSFGDAADYFFGYLFGSGPALNDHYGPNSVQMKDLQRSSAIEEVRRELAGEPPGTQGIVPNPARSGKTWDGISTFDGWKYSMIDVDNFTEWQIGGFDWRAEIQGNRVHFSFR